jgi:hypothetical protein
MDVMNNPIERADPIRFVETKKHPRERVPWLDLLGENLFFTGR